MHTKEIRLVAMMIAHVLYFLARSTGLSGAGVWMLKQPHDTAGCRLARPAKSARIFFLVAVAEIIGCANRGLFLHV